VIIPKAYTAENHQEYNAKSIEKQGGGVCILEKQLTPERLNDTVLKLLGDREALMDMSRASKDIGKPEAIDLIYDEVMNVVIQNNKQSTTPKIEKKSKNKEDKVQETYNNAESEPKIIGIKKK